MAEAANLLDDNFVIIRFSFSVFIWTFPGLFLFCFGTSALIKQQFKGSGCGLVGRAVASDSSGPQFETSHRQKIYNQHLLSTVVKRRK